MADIKAFKVTDLPNDTHLTYNLTVVQLANDSEAELRRLELWDNVLLLSGVNERLFELVKDRLDQEAGRVPNAVADARKATDSLYHALVYAVNAFATVAPADFATFIRTMNLNIDRLNASVFRKGSSGSESTDGGKRRGCRFFCVGGAQGV